MERLSFRSILCFYCFKVYLFSPS